MKIYLFFAIALAIFTSTYAVICPGAERIVHSHTSCSSSVFYTCDRSIGLRRACNYQLRQPSTWRRGINVLEACQRNLPPERFTAISTFQGPDNNPYYGRIRHEAVFLECGPSNSLIVMDQFNPNRTSSLWGRSTMQDRGSELNEYNSRLYYVIEKSFTRH